LYFFKFSPIADIGPTAQLRRRSAKTLLVCPRRDYARNRNFGREREMQINCVTQTDSDRIRELTTRPLSVVACSAYSALRFPAAALSGSRLRMRKTYEGPSIHFRLTWFPSSDRRSLLVSYERPPRYEKHNTLAFLVRIFVIAWPEVMRQPRVQRQCHSDPRIPALPAVLVGFCHASM
jgi:hypothetical protein